MYEKTIKKLAVLALGMALLQSCGGSADESMAAGGGMGTDGGQWINMSGSFDGWQQTGGATWTIEDGVFIGSGMLGHLVTDETFDNFRIRAQFWAGEGANSGIFMRIADPANILDTTAYEANIYDNRPDQSGRTGGIVNHAPPSMALITPGKWNTYDITMDGDHITVWLNEVKTVDTHDATYSSGHISLQYGSGDIRFRNVEIMRL
jgi:hypothetical protein